MVFTSSGLDATCHRLVQDAAPALVESGGNARTLFDLYLKQQMELPKAPEGLLDAITSLDPRSALVRRYIDAKTMASYQGSSGLRVRDRDLLGIPKEALPDARFAALDGFFTAYMAQLLRRMPGNDATGGYAVVVPTVALRVPAWVRERLPAHDRVDAGERLSPYQRVRRLEFRELPKTVSGRLRRLELRLGEDVTGRLSGPGGLDLRRPRPRRRFPERPHRTRCSAEVLHDRLLTGPSTLNFIGGRLKARSRTGTGSGWCHRRPGRPD